MQPLNSFEQGLMEKERRAQPKLREFQRTVTGHVRDEMRGRHTYESEVRAASSGQEASFTIKHVNEASANAYKGRIDAAIKKYGEAISDAGWSVTTERKKYMTDHAGPMHETIIHLNGYGSLRPNSAPGEFGRHLVQEAGQSQKRSLHPSIPAVLRDLELFQQRVVRAVQAASKGKGVYGPLGTGKKFNVRIRTSGKKEAAILHRRISDIASHHRDSLKAAGWNVELTPVAKTGESVWLDVLHTKAKLWHRLSAAQPERLRKALAQLTR